jgi:tetrapyrrole methylase family protein/MazG family protein
MDSAREKLAYIYSGRGVDRLERLLEVLRGPGGCPWDREQTHRTLLRHLLEEAYEFIEAVEKDAEPALVEELGDLLLQVVFHAQLLKERSRWSLMEIAERVVDKLILRHPHVFGDARAESAEDVLKQWEERKSHKRKGITEGIPPDLPSLLFAQKVSERAAYSGLEFKGVGEVLEKVKEELDEFSRTLSEPLDPKDRKERLEEEVGDLIFAVVNLARMAGVDAELATRRAIRKFSERFDRMEKPSGARTDSPELMALWDSAWEKAKRLPG